MVTEVHVRMIVIFSAVMLLFAVLFKPWNWDKQVWSKSESSQVLHQNGELVINGDSLMYAPSNKVCTETELRAIINLTNDKTIIIIK